MSRPWIRWIALVLLLFVAGGCETNPATGRQSLMLLSANEERQLGASEHPKLVRQFGGAYADAALADYVRTVGARLAATTETPDIPFTFTILDDETVNAMALPGGYVHISRGLLALADNEAEMAGVLAHEIGHVVARHSAERYTQAMGAGLLAGIAGLAGAAAGVPVGNLPALGAQLYVQSYSRDQELEADMLAVRYLTRAGYDPAAMATFLARMQGYARLEATLAGNPEAADQLNLLSSHPRTPARVEQAIQLAKLTPVADPRVGRDEYLSRIDGLRYGDNPEQGIRIGRDFFHPGLGVAFRVPPGFTLHNNPNAVIARGPGGALILFDLEQRAGGGDLSAYVGREWSGQMGLLGLAGVEAIEVNGMAAATGATRAATRGGGAVDVRLVAIRATADRVYRFAFLTPPALTVRLATELQRTTYSFHRLSAEEAARVRPLRLHVVTPRQADTAERLAQRMPFADYRLERFLALNGLAGGGLLPPGRKVKVIVQ
jgi:predicted Zn-dependent protease